VLCLSSGLIALTSCFHQSWFSTSVGSKRKKGVDDCVSLHIITKIMGNITKGSLYVAFFFTLISRTQLVLFYLLVFFLLACI
jgi:hypothetical protein